MRNSIVVPASLAKGATGWAFDLDGGPHPHAVWKAVSVALGKQL